MTLPDTDPTTPLPPPSPTTPVTWFPPPTLPGLRVAWIAGPDAGGLVDVEQGRWFVGRARAAHVRCDDPAIALHHALIEIDAAGGITIVQLSGRTPLTIEGGGGGPFDLQVGSRVRMGASVLEVRDRARRLDRTVDASADPLTPLAAPRIGAATNGSGGRLAPAITGISIATVLSLLTQQAWFAVAGVLGGLVAVLIWAAQKTADLRSAGAASSEHDAAVAMFAEQVAQLRQAATSAHVAAAPTLDRVLAARPLTDIAVAADPGRAFRASIGIGDVGWSPALVGPTRGGAGSSHWTAITTDARLASVPVVAELGPGAVLAIVGGEAARAVVRAVVLQLVGQHGPGRLRFAIRERVDGCEMFEQLPYMKPCAASSSDVMSANTVRIETPAEHREGVGTGAAIVICPNEASIPHDATSVLITCRDGGDGRARWIADTRDSALAEPVSFTGISAVRATAAVRYLTSRPPVVKVEALCRESSPWAPPSSVPCRAATTAPASSPV